MSCNHDGCNDPVYGRGMCRAHYAADHRRRTAENVCTIKGCGRPVLARGLCNRCYKRRLREHMGYCSVDGCRRRPKVNGMCMTCHRRAEREAEMRQCANPRCDVWFHPSHNAQLYCSPGHRHISAPGWQCPMGCGDIRNAPCGETECKEWARTMGYEPPKMVVEDRGFHMPDTGRRIPRSPFKGFG